jgi:hypothetical protein
MPKPGRWRRFREGLLKTEPLIESAAQVVKPPKLLYLAWQHNLQPGSEGKFLWDRNRKELAETEAFLKRAGSIGFAQRIDGLPPLVLFFEVDPSIDAPVNAALMVEGRDIISTGSARTSSVDGINVSAIEPLQNELPAWPDSVSLQLTYATENWQVIKTVNEVSKQPIEVVEGVRWYLDPARAREHDPQTGRLRRAEGKTAAILELNESVQKGLIAYGVRLYLKGKSTPMRESHSTVVTREDGNNTIRVSEAFDSVDQIDRVEFISQRRAIETIDDVPLRLEFLPPDPRLVPPQRDAAYEDAVFDNPEPIAR